MKKIFLTLLIFSLGLSAFAKPNYSYTVHQTPTPIQTNNSVYNYDYMPQTNQTSNTQATSNSNYGIYVDEEITTPLTQIGLPEYYLQPQEEEKGLEIEWNEWHANVRNYIMKDVMLKNILYGFATDSLYCVIYTVHKDKSISDIIVVQLKRNDYANDKITIKGKGPYLDSEFGVAIKQNGESSYKTRIYKAPNFDIKQNSTPVDLLNVGAYQKDAKFFNLVEVYVADKVAKNIEKSAYNSVWAFPVKSKREKMVVSQIIALGFTPEGFVDAYKSSNFNDIEKIK